MISLCLCPLSPEFQALAKALGELGLTSESPDSVDHQFLFYPQLNLYLGKAGIGNSRFQKNAKWYIEKIKPQLFICAGGAGALTPDLEVSTVIAQTADRKLAQQLHEIAGIATGSHTIACSDVVVADVGTATELHEETGSIAVGMEGRGAVEASSLAGVTCVEIRAVTDNIFSMNPGVTIEAEYMQNIPAAMTKLAEVLKVFLNSTRPTGGSEA